MPAFVRSADGASHAVAIRRTTGASAFQRPGFAGTFVARSMILSYLLLVPGSLSAQTIEQTDSGWSVARPTNEASAKPTSNPQMRLLVDHVLTQPDAVVLKAVTSRGVEPRVAERAGSSLGWRPVVRSTGSVIGKNSGRGEAGSPTGGGNMPTDVKPVPLVSEDGAEKPNLKFRTPLLHSSTLGEPPGAEATAITRRPNPLPPDELTPELLPGGIWLRPGAATEPTDRSAASKSDGPRTSAEEPAGDDIPDATESADSNSANVEPETGLPKSDEQPNADDKPTAVENKAEPPAVTSPTAAPPPLTPQLTNLRKRVRNVLHAYYQKPLNSQEHDPWEVMHGMLAYGIHSRIRQNGPRGEQITAVGWLCYNRPCKGKSLLYVTPEGELRAKQGVGLQGHMGQLLAMLAQCHVSPEYPIRVGANEFTIGDLIEAEKKTCYPKSELTFKLISFAHYVDLEATWVNDQGLDWDFSRLIREELAQPIRGAACGGTHRLSGLSLAVKARQKSGAPIDGEYARAAEFVKNYQNYAFRMQNRDGSLSTKWFQGSGDEADIDRRIKTTGHILEWLIYSLSDEQLREPRTVRAVTYLTNLLSSNFDHEWEIGPRSHAIHALLLYDERVFRPFDPEGQTVFSTPGQPATGSRRSSNRR
jgi:hypothetical protein